MFYEPELDEGLTILNKTESHHCVKVLRMKEGDKLLITNGKGMLCEADLITADPKGCFIEITDFKYGYDKRPYTLHIAIAPTKSIDRFEWFLEKATECGIDIITPLLCEHSERKVIKPYRLKKLVAAAMKQSCRTFLPELNPLTNFSDFVNNTENPDYQFIAHCGKGEKLQLNNLYKSGNDIIIAIGPEGDFSDTEISLANSAGFQAISMGKYRLRTETAAIAACIQANSLNNLL